MPASAVVSTLFVTLLLRGPAHAGTTPAPTLGESSRDLLAPPRAPAAPVTPEAPAPPPVSDELRDWLDHVRALEQRGIQRGADVGGVAMIGIGPGGRGNASEIEGIEELPPEQIAQLNGWDDRGALVLRVVEGSPAEAAGLRPGDIIVQLGGFWIDTPGTLVKLASRAQPGREIEVQFLRGDEIERTWLLPVDRRDLEPPRQEPPADRAPRR